MIDESHDASPSAFIADYIRDVEKSRIHALVTRNVELLWKLHASDYQLITPTGRTFSRERYLREIDRETCGTLNGKPVLWTSERVSKWPSFDIKPHLSLIRGDGQGTPFQCWHTDSYELKDEVWQAVWSQATAIR